MEPGIQVTPITEAEMSTLRNLFNRFADTIVSASALQTEVDTLRARVQGLVHDVEGFRSRNRELDEQVVEVRRQRDEAIRQRDEALVDANTLRQSNEGDHSKVAELREDVARLNNEIVQARRDRDDASYRNLELIEQSTANASKLQQAKDWIENVQRLFHNPPTF